MRQKRQKSVLYYASTRLQLEITLSFYCFLLYCYLLTTHWQHPRLRHLLKLNVYFLFADFSAVMLETECPSLLRCMSV